MRFDELTLGQSAESARTITEQDVLRFADVSGDHNPVHVDEAFASRTRFGGRIAHGMFVASMISTAIASDLPGPGSVYLGQSLKFLKPARIGDTITVRLEVLELIPEKKRARLATTCRNQGGETILEGEALIMIAGDG